VRIAGNNTWGRGGAREFDAAAQLGVEFIRTLQQDFTTHGKDVIASLRIDEPRSYLKLIMVLAPDQIEVDPFKQMEDDELRAIVQAARDALAEQQKAAAAHDTEEK